MAAQRKIIHIDMDAFFAAVEQRDRPELRGRPVIVGGAPQSRSVVCAASYEVRPYGVHSAMPCAEAARRCPTAIFVAPDFQRYRQASQGFHQILRRYTDCIEPLSLDEAYLDVTQNHVGSPSATWIAEAIRSQVREELGLTCSAGVAPCKFIAKIASDHHKPDGICVVPPAAVLDFLRDLPLRRIPGIGPVSEARLAAAGLRSIADVRALGAQAVVERFGDHGRYIWAMAHGIDERPVQSSRERKSIGIETTFARDLIRAQDIEAKCEGLITGLVERMAAKDCAAQTLTVKVKYHDFRQVTRSRSLSEPWWDASAIRELAMPLLATTDIGQTPIRLLGLSASRLVERQVWRGRPRQLDLFDLESGEGFDSPPSESR